MVVPPKHWLVRFEEKLKRRLETMADEKESLKNKFKAEKLLLEQAADRIPALQAWPVDRRVNNARNEGEDLISAAGDVLR